MKAKYIIRQGATFRMPDGSLKGPGDEIELDSDVVQAHPHSVMPVAGETKAVDAEPKEADAETKEADAEHAAPHVPLSMNPTVA